jgi:hypothetical protein
MPLVLCRNTMAWFACLALVGVLAANESVPDWAAIRKIADRIQVSYSSATWVVRDIANKVDYHLAWSGPNMKWERQSEGAVLSASVFGREMVFAVGRDIATQPFELGSVAPRPKYVFFDHPEKCPAGFAFTDRYFVRPLTVPWQAALAAEHFHLHSDSGGTSIKSGSRAAGRSEWVKLDGHKVCRVVFHTAESGFTHTTDFRPDLDWAVVREEKSYPGYVKDGNNDFTKMKPAERAHELRVRPRAFVVNEIGYDGMVGGVPKVALFKTIGWSSQNIDNRAVSCHIEVVTATEGALPEVDFLPEHYGVAYSKPRTGSWRWIAGAVGVIGVVFGWWWLRRRSRAAGAE